MALNIGCGGNKIYRFRDLNCQVNADLIRPTVKIRNFVLCDAHQLPFRDRVFDVVYAYHLLEHLKDPRAAVREACRVGAKAVFLCPHYLNPNAYQDSTHLWVFYRSYPHSIKNRVVRLILLRAVSLFQKLLKILNVKGIGFPDQVLVKTHYPDLLMEKSCL